MEMAARRIQAVWVCCAASRALPGGGGRRHAAQRKLTCPVPLRGGSARRLRPQIKARPMASHSALRGVRKRSDPRLV